VWDNLPGLHVLRLQSLAELLVPVLFRIDAYANASSMELNLVWDVSPRDVKTIGADPGPAVTTAPFSMKSPRLPMVLESVL